MDINALMIYADIYVIASETVHISQIDSMPEISGTDEHTRRSFDQSVLIFWISS